MSEQENDILQAVAKEYGVSIDDIASRSQRSDISEARHMAMYLISEISGYDPERIGKVFGRSRMTAIYAVRKIRDLASVDKLTQRHLVNLRSAVGMDMTQNGVN